MRRAILLASAAVLVLVFATAGGSVGQAAPPKPANVQVTASQAEAEPGNSARAHLLVVVTNPTNGTPIVGLPQSSFTVVNHLLLPGQTCGFSNNVETFIDVGTGAYQLEVAPVGSGCKWVEGDYLTQVIVQAPGAVGQGTTTLHVDTLRHALEVQVTGLQGTARPGNSAGTVLMVNVTDRSTGMPVYGLQQAVFYITWWGPSPGCGGKTTNFGEHGSGIYWMEIKPYSEECTWGEGDYAFTMWVFEPPAGYGRQGQTNGVLHIAALP